jgi:methionyl-tRNA formyltransferase
MGDKVTGGTVYWLDRNTDGGPIAAQKHVFVLPGETPEELWRRALFPLGLDLFRTALNDIDAGVLRRIPQDEAVATWEPSWSRPPLYKPELIQIGRIEGFSVVSGHQFYSYPNWPRG